MAEDSHKDICLRIAKLRMETAGPRGKASFAKQLNLSPSTYDYYESGRVPPADVLVRIAEIAGVDLRWLLTGQSSGPRVAPDHPILRRAAEMLAERPDAAGPLAAFLDILAQALQFPSKPAAAEAPPGAARQAGMTGPVAPAAGLAEGPAAISRSARAAEAEEAEVARRPAAPAGPQAPTGAPKQEALPPPADPAAAKATWIPILGRSAAGVPQFWADDKEATGLTTLDELIARHATARPQVRPAAAWPGEGEPESSVQIVTLAGGEAAEVVEFVVAPRLKARHGDAFALRVDGDSMAPDIRHGDLVIVSPAAPAADGRPAVVQLRGQIGVTCKLFRRAGEAVHLVPINESYAPTTCPAGEVVWAFRVLARVRPGVS